MIETFRILEYQIPARYLVNIDQEFLDISVINEMATDRSGKEYIDKKRVFINIKTECQDKVMANIIQNLPNDIINSIDKRVNDGMRPFDAMAATLKDLEDSKKAE